MIEPAALPEAQRALLLLLRDSQELVRVHPSWDADVRELEALELVVRLTSKHTHVRLTLAGRLVANECHVWDVLGEDDDGETLESRTRAQQLTEAGHG